MMKRGRRAFFLVAIAGASCSTGSRPISEPFCPAGPVARNALVAADPDADEPVAGSDDRARVETLERAAQELMDQKKATPMDTLRGQLERSQCSLRLARPSRRRLTPAEIYERCRSSVLIVGGVSVRAVQALARRRHDRVSRQRVGGVCDQLPRR